MALLQEPYTGSSGSMGMHAGVRIYQNTNVGEGKVKAAIAIFDHDLTVIQYPKLTTNNIVVVGIRTVAWEIILVSFYFEPDLTIEPYISQMENIVQTCRCRGVIIGGDANSKSTWWGSLKTDDRGNDMAGALGDMGLYILNSGDTPTFDTIRGGQRYHSYIDVTACSVDLLDLIEQWRVDEGLTSSDHNGILFNIRLIRSKGLAVSRTT